MKAPKIVNVRCPLGTRVKEDETFGVVKKLLREDIGGKDPNIVALVYWDNGRMSFENDHDLKPVYALGSI